MKTKNTKGKKRFGPSKKGIVIHGKWKAVELDPNIFANEALGEVVCFEELTDYSMIDANKVATKSQLKKDTTGNKKQNKRKASEIEADEDIVEEELSSNEGAGKIDVVDETAKKRKKKKKKSKKNAVPHETKNEDDKESQSSLEDMAEEIVDDIYQESEESHDIISETPKKTKKKKKRKKKQKSAEQLKPASEAVCDKSDVPLSSKKKAKNWSDAALTKTAGQEGDVSAWKDLFVPEPVLKALSKLGFSAPTPIQALALPPAIRDHLDILGAAETGSGKTLSFGIPVIHRILEWKKRLSYGTESADEKPESAKQVESIYLPSVSDSKEDDDDGSDALNNEKIVNEEISTEVEENEEGQDDQEEEDDYEGDTGSVNDQSQDDDDDDGSGDEAGVIQTLDLKATKLEEEDRLKQPLLGLVLTPTRELAVQVKHHIDAVAQFTGIRTAILVGGMAPQKQDRMLKRRPEIVIATPGRLWEMIQDKHPHLHNLRQLRCLVIDEADRMVEKGHFAELENLLEMLNTSQFNPKRQTFVFSATLTMVHSLPSRVMRKKGKKLEQRSKLELLMEKVGIKGKPKIIDLTRKEATVETLTETRIHCEKEEKDYYLYYFLLQYPGRTMVFANSIDCIKRLNSLLTILECIPLPLHANMHQKQRLKNLERFAERESCVLLTTDVAARGLDIPDVQHVIHYQVPRTSETYVHRSGRTARAAKEGLSLLLIGPDDMINYKKIYKTLGKDEDLPLFPIQNKCMAAMKERVDVARKIEKIEFHNSREKHHNSWLKQAAEEMEIDLDDDLLMGRGRDEEHERELQRLVKGLKKHLKHLLTQPVFKAHMKTKYPTQMGKLQLPELPVANETALTSVTNQKQKQQQNKKRKQ
ncbi:ATP-dependent RNA helicase DDX24 [Trichomycterus rosablanca]|uniref:ATP-dependent RNA helicase DDX24 n=1 Tax=Trichomycterus rosablanca TaxID=2290929 RepID=UPI002F350798